MITMIAHEELLIDAAKLAGYDTLGAMGLISLLKNKDEWPKHKAIFVDGAVSRGCSEHIASVVFDIVAWGAAGCDQDQTKSLLTNLTEATVRWMNERLYPRRPPPHRHTGWTGEKCKWCGGTGDNDCRSCLACGGTGDEHDDVATAEQCTDQECPDKAR